MSRKQFVMPPDGYPVTMPTDAVAEEAIRTLLQQQPVFILTDIDVCDYNRAPKCAPHPDSK